jgi:hypothetical protein
MFVLMKEHRFSWPVAFDVPMEHGARVAQGFTARFRVLPQSRIEDINLRPAELMAEAVVGWEGVLDEAGQPVPFSAATLADLLDIPFILVGLAQAYADAVSGAGARKN